MRNFWIIGAFGLAIAATGIVRANAAGAAAPSKVGYVDLQRTLNETKVGKAAKGRHEGEKAKKQKQIDQEQDDLKKAAEELDKQRVVLKTDVLKQREKELQDKYVSLQQKFLQFQQDLAKSETLLTREIFQ